MKLINITYQNNILIKLNITYQNNILSIKNDRVTYKNIKNMYAEGCSEMLHVDKNIPSEVQMKMLFLCGDIAKAAHQLENIIRETKFEETKFEK